MWTIPQLVLAIIGRLKPEVSLLKHKLQRISCFAMSYYMGQSVL